MVIKLCWQLFVLGLKEFSSLQWNKWNKEFSNLFRHISSPADENLHGIVINASLPVNYLLLVCIFPLKNCLAFHCVDGKYFVAVALQ